MDKKKKRPTLFSLAIYNWGVNFTNNSSFPFLSFSLSLFFWLSSSFCGPPYSVYATGQRGVHHVTCWNVVCSSPFFVCSLVLRTQSNKRKMVLQISFSSFFLVLALFDRIIAERKRNLNLIAFNAFQNFFVVYVIASLILFVVNYFSLRISLSLSFSLSWFTKERTLDCRIETSEVWRLSDVDRSLNSGRLIYGPFPSHSRRYI